MALELVADEGFNGGDVEIALHQSFDDVSAQSWVARIEPVVAVFEPAALVEQIPVVCRLARRRGVADALAVIDADGRPAGILENLALIVADHDQNIEPRRLDVGVQTLHALGCRAVALDNGVVGDFGGGAARRVLEDVFEGSRCYVKIAYRCLAIDVVEQRQPVVERRK